MINMIYMKNIDIDIYVENLIIESIGVCNGPSCEYVCLGRKRYLNRSDQESSRFDEICSKLGLASCDVIKIHYRELYKLIDVLKRI